MSPFDPKAKSPFVPYQGPANPTTEARISRSVSPPRSSPKPGVVRTPNKRKGSPSIEPGRVLAPGWDASDLPVVAWPEGIGTGALKVHHLGRRLSSILSFQVELKLDHPLYHLI